MLNLERLTLALDIHRRSYKLLKWIGKTVDGGLMPVDNVSRHSDDPSAANEWLESNYAWIPDDIKPDRQHLGEFANFFWTYLTTSFDVVEQPGNLTSPGECGCMCPLCARISKAPHLRPKKLRRADKQRAADLMIDRILELAREQSIHIAQSDACDLANDESMRRGAAYSAYGHWLIQRLEGDTAGPAVLALWREIAWNRKGSPIQGFRLKVDEFVDAENAIVAAISNVQ